MACIFCFIYGPEDSSIMKLLLRRTLVRLGYKLSFYLSEVAAIGIHNKKGAAIAAPFLLNSVSTFLTLKNRHQLLLPAVHQYCRISGNVFLQKLLS